MCWYLGEFGSVSIDLTRQAFERVLGAPPPAAPRLAWTGRGSSDRARTAASAPGAGRAELKEGAAQAAPLSRPGKRKESFFKRKPLNSRSNCIRRLMSLSPRFRPGPGTGVGGRSVGRGCTHGGAAAPLRAEDEPEAPASPA